MRNQKSALFCFYTVYSVQIDLTVQTLNIHESVRLATFESAFINILLSKPNRPPHDI